MPFKQGVRPTIIVSREDRRTFRGDLFATGYRPHNGARTRRDDEIQAWVKPIGRGRQVHVQEELLDDGSVAVFAHTEPEGETFAHLVAAIFDQASYSGGARALRADLRSRGWDL